MLKVKAPSDHNWTHLSYPRTLWDAFNGKGDMHLSAPTHVHTPLDKGLLALFLLQWVTVLFFSFVVFYLVAYV
jgi:hypothetical protein